MSGRLVALHSGGTVEQERNARAAYLSFAVPVAFLAELLGADELEYVAPEPESSDEPVVPLFEFVAAIAVAEGDLLYTPRSDRIIDHAHLRASLTWDSPAERRLDDVRFGHPLRVIWMTGGAAAPIGTDS
jgi:hypothetical protein